MLKNIYLFICGCAGSLFQCGLLPGCGERGYSLLAVCRLLLLQSAGSGLHLVSVIAACGLSSWGAGLQGTGSLLAVLGFTCPAPSAPCGIFPDQGSTRGLLHWPSGSSPLSPWGRPSLRFSLPTGVLPCQARTGTGHADVTFLACLQLFPDHFVPLWSTGLGRTLLWFSCGPTRGPKMAVYQSSLGLKLFARVCCQKFCFS